MTQAQLEKRLRRLQTAMNLDHWNIEVKFVDVCADNEDAGAAVMRSPSYDAAEIHVSTKHTAELTDFEVDVTLAHELMHVLMRDYDAAINQVLEYVPEKQRAVFDAWLDHAEEGVVDRLARTVVSCLTA